MILSPQKIILGGGVMHQEQLFPLIRRKVKELVNGYICSKELDDIDNYIVPASLNDDQGIMGAIRLGLNALERGKIMSGHQPVSALKGIGEKTGKLFEKLGSSPLMTHFLLSESI